MSGRSEPLSATWEKKVEVASDSTCIDVETGEASLTDFDELRKRFPALEYLPEMEEAIFADGMEKALIAVGYQFNHAVAIYDRRLCLEILMERDGMTYEEAVEFFDFNIAGAYVGDHTPVYISTWAEREDESNGQEDKSDTGSSDHN